MPTVPNLDDAGTLGGPDLLWLTQGLGLDRDRKLDLDTLRAFVLGSRPAVGYNLLSAGLGASAGPGGSYTNANATSASLRIALLSQDTYAVRISLKFSSAAVPSAWYAGSPPPVTWQFKLPTATDSVVAAWAAKVAAEPSSAVYFGGVDTWPTTPSPAPWLAQYSNGAPPFITVIPGRLANWAAGTIPDLELSWVHSFCPLVTL